MENLLDLILSIAEQVSSEPQEVLSDSLFQAEESLSLKAEQPKPPSAPAVGIMEPTLKSVELKTPAVFLQREMTAGSSAEVLPADRNLGSVAETLGSENAVGPEAQVLDVSRVAGAHAVAAIKEQMSAPGAEPIRRTADYGMQVNPEQRVRVVMPPADDFDFLTAFQQFDSKIRLPEMGSDMDNQPPQLPDYEQTGEIPSTEQFVADAAIALLQNDSSSDRMVYG